MLGIEDEFSSPDSMVAVTRGTKSAPWTDAIGCVLLKVLSLRSWTIQDSSDYEKWKSTLN